MPPRSRRATPVVRCACLLAVAACAASPAGARREAPARPLVAPTGIPVPPTARTVAHVDAVRGVPVPDPYRWREDTLAADARAWVAGQERYASDVLARVVGRDSLTAACERAFRDAPTLDRVLDTPAGLVLTRWLGDAPSMFASAHAQR